jgi:pimeloyl-ACP methyl ester carboxylesterase
MSARYASTIALVLSGVIAPSGALAAEPSATHPWVDPSPHRASLVTVDQDVQLEVLDWGGTGRPVVLLTGLGNTAHVYDDFAPKLTGKYHVYGISRRGYGASSVPKTGYSADRLGDDVLAVLAALKLDRPVLVGHSIAGEELSSIGSRHPERVSGLVYLDATYGYAFYDSSHGWMSIDAQALRSKLERLLQEDSPWKTAQELLNTDLPAFERTLRQLPVDYPDSPGPTATDIKSFQGIGEWFTRSRGIRFPEAEFRAGGNITEDGGPAGPKTPPWVSQAILAGGQKYTQIPAPILAICATPQDLGPISASMSPAARDKLQVIPRAQAEAFERGVPTAHVVRLAQANHYVFLSNEADVLREIGAFIDGLH